MLITFYSFIQLRIDDEDCQNKLLGRKKKDGITAQISFIWLTFDFEQIYSFDRH